MTRATFPWGVILRLLLLPLPVLSGADPRSVPVCRYPCLLQHFLNTEGVDPSCLAYDRPSPKLLGFLYKHYGTTCGARRCVSDAL